MQTLTSVFNVLTSILNNSGCIAGDFQRIITEVKAHAKSQVVTLIFLIFR